jgi:2-methylcitrate dehydratase PrpD
VATRLIHGHSRLPAFTWEAVRDERVRTLAAKVSLSEDPAMSARLPMERPARITLTDRQGRAWVGEAGVNRGDDASPYTAEELSAKFMDLCGRVWPESHNHRLLQATHELCAGQLPLQPWLQLLMRAPQA